ncbi:MAG: PLDc N-terminal domain-containing protein [Mucilaginibacter sp.]
MQPITYAIGGTFGLIFLIVWALLSLYSLVSVLRNNNINGGTKILWVVIIIVVPILGSLVYLFWRSVKEL